MVRSAWLALAFALMVLMVSVAGCSEPTAWADARDMERKLLMANPQANYADPGYLRIAQRLEQVSPSAADYPKAQELLGKIHDARRLAVGEAYGLGYVPQRLAALSPVDLRPVTEGVAPVKPTVVEKEAPRVAAAPASAPQAEPALASAGAGEPVILYATSWCGYCKKARAYFKRNGVQYVEKDIERDPEAARELRAKVGGYSGVPVIDIDGKVIRGYDLPSIKRALAMRETSAPPNP